MINLFHKLRWVHIRNNFQSFSFMVMFILITLALFVHRYGQYHDTTVALQVARASAATIYWHSGLVLVLILRKSISYLRSFGLARYLPLDHYVYFHKITGWSIAFFSLVHTLAHLYNFATLTDLTTIPYGRFLFSVNLGIGWFYGSACLTGWILLAILAVMLIFTLNFVRRTGNFEFFYYSHKLYVLYILFLFFHASSTVQWLTAPIIFLLFEKILSQIRVKKDHHGQTYAIEGTMLPSRVLRLVIRKPKFFHFVPGDFVYMMVPSITKYEWHPMTISSAPEDKELTLHIRAVGEWTNRLYDHFDHAKTLTVKKMLEEWKCLDFHPLFKHESNIGRFEQQVVVGEHESSGMFKRKMILPVPEDCDEDGCGKKKKSTEQIEIESCPSGSDTGADLERAMEMKKFPSGDAAARQQDQIDLKKPLMLLENIHKDVQTNAVFLREPLKIHLDGPYGAPSSNIFESEHAVLIATGIGVTPFASILQSIMYRHIEKTRNCPSCNHNWVEKVLSREINNLRKVDFIWINRNQNSFEWFVELLSDLAKQQASVSAKDDRFFDIHMYITGKDSKQPIDYDNHRTGKARTSVLENYNDTIHWRFGRPQWEEIFQNIKQNRHGKVTVFYCGRPDISGYLRQKCSENDFVFKKEVF